MQVTEESVRLGAQAIRAVRANYERERRQASIETYGHPGASIGTLPWPTLEDEVRAALVAVARDQRSAVVLPEEAGA